MIVIPAIDIKDGKVVRLSQGKFHEITIYSDDPVTIAKRWEKVGAPWLHVVDLDGAEKGEIKNFPIIAEIVKVVKIPVQMGGGIRTADDIEKLLSSGIRRVILGTKVVEDKVFLKKIIEQWADRVIVSLDCSRGIVAEKGWTSLSNLKATNFAKELEDLGLNTLIYTDITRDGTMQGPNINGINEILNSVNIPVIASGGVASLEDIKKLKALGPKKLMGVIIGKALYEGQFYLKDAIDLCLQKE